jgi:DNA-directed RNA polymerase subunit RPC12/RpoP
MMLPMNAPGDRPTRHSLWRELADGNVAGWVCLLVNLAAGVFLTGAAFLLSFFLAALVPALRYERSSYIRPTDEAVAAAFVLCGLAFLGATAWLWSRKSRKRALLRPALWTIIIGGATIILCVVAADAFRGMEEIIVSGLIFVAGGIVILVWTSAWFHLSRGRPMRNEQDGLPDIRCPACGYRMVGLREARCPECGQSYTLDELLGSQGFSRVVESDEQKHRVQQVG